MRSIQLAPSLLACDFTKLGDQIVQAHQAGITYLHVDVMDGRFVPNISIGLPVVESLRPLAQKHQLVLDVHLMIVEPEKYLEPFAKAGANILTVHAEACPHLHRTIQQIKELGCQAGVALNPATPTTVLEEILPEVDLVLVMSVNPGFGGQSYIPASTNKILRVRRMLDMSRSQAWLEVDGGVNAQNIGSVVRAGANLVVAGSAVFGGSQSIAENVAQLQTAVQNAGSFTV
jgi:ribulose-phosphate 3-epimerase